MPNADPMSSPGPVTRPAWPLFLLAALSFIPGFGFLIGSVAAAWGLLSRRRRALVAAGIGAAGAILNVVGMVIIGQHAISRNPEAIERATTVATRQDLLAIVEALESYRKQEGGYPASLSLLQRKSLFKRSLNLYDHSGGLFAGFRLYHYQVAPDGASYDLFAVGADGKPETADDIRPVLPDSLIGRGGLKH